MTKAHFVGYKFEGTSGLAHKFDRGGHLPVPGRHEVLEIDGTKWEVLKVEVEHGGDIPQYILHLRKTA